MKVALVYDLPSEYPGLRHAAADRTDINWHVPLSLNTIQAALSSEHEVILISHDAMIEDHLLSTWPDLVLRLTDDFGRSDDNVTLSSLLERWHIPYVGSPPRTLQLCQDRGAIRQVLRKQGLPTPVHTVAQVPSDLRDIDQFPVSIQPLFARITNMGGEECLAYTPRDLREQVRLIVEMYDQPALVETFMPGRIFTVAILGNGSEATVLPLVERCYVMPSIDNRSKSGLHPAFECPATIGAELEQQIIDLGQQAFLGLGCLDFCSLHFRLDENEQVYITEICPQPVLLPQPGCSSAFLQAASAAGMTYVALISRILRLTCQRQGLNV
jgi:D-alanine-D-alanine ligase